MAFSCFHCQFDGIGPGQFTFSNYRICVRGCASDWGHKGGQVSESPQGDTDLETVDVNINVLGLWERPAWDTVGAQRDETKLASLPKPQCLGKVSACPWGTT